MTNDQSECCASDQSECCGPPAQGTFCWYELMTRDTAAAKEFYSDLFGWTWMEMDMGEHGTTTCTCRPGRSSPWAA